MREYIGKDYYGHDMYLYHYCNTVYCDHVKNGKVMRTKSLIVDNDIVNQFHVPTITGDRIYQEIKQRYHRKL
jgi:hypothetical protein